MWVCVRVWCLHYKEANGIFSYVSFIHMHTIWCEIFSALARTKDVKRHRQKNIIVQRKVKKAIKYVENEN